MCLNWHCKAWLNYMQNAFTMLGELRLRGLATASVYGGDSEVVGRAGVAAPQSDLSALGSLV